MSTEELIEEKTGESEYERTARELGELLQELRVALPGVQVLFAFLLTVPFSTRFGSVTPLQEAIFFATLVCTALSAGLLLAPSAHHRLLWRQHAREHRLRVANRFAITGMILLALAMMGTVFVITDVLFGSIPASVTAVLIAAFFLYVWVRSPDAVPPERGVAFREALRVRNYSGERVDADQRRNWPERGIAADC